MALRTLDIDITSGKETTGPYIGPRFFRRNTEDVLWFFGRDDETDEIVSLISGHKLVLVYAQSGAGKTSIFNSQVIPKLEKYGFEVLPMARVKNDSTMVVDISPAAANLHIFNALQSINPKIDTKLLTNKSLTDFLNDYYPNHIDDNGEIIPQVLIFDQLEELFISSKPRGQVRQII